jgi:glycosyltransferase involved in cell wall biosynthesis
MVFTYVGSVGTWYAMEELLDFFGVALAEIPTAALLLIVRGPLAPLRESVERKGFLAVSSIASSVPNGEIPKWLSISKVGVAFYRQGISNIARFPTKIGEYLASGLPVVVSGGVGDCDRIVEGERVGVSVREFTVPEYQRAARLLRELLRDEGLPDRCRRTALTHLSLAVGVQRYYSVYRHLMGLKGPA